MAQLQKCKTDSSATIQWDNAKHSDENQEKAPKEVITRVKLKGNGARLSSSTSAHDLRFLDIKKEKEDESAPRCVLENYYGGLEFDKNSQKDIPSESDVGCTKRAHHNWGKFFKLSKLKSIKRLSIRRSRSTKDDPVLRDIYSFQSSLHQFTLSELESATNKFDPENIIGIGGYADVYQGILPDGKHVAIKRLTKGTQEERTSSFLSELGIIAHVNHPNTAKLMGCGVDGGMHLVFQLSPLGSLGSLLYGPSKAKLDWSKRYKIALGTADGLTYLHESCQRRIIHRDIKTDNILLTEDFGAQICDFGLAKWLPGQWTHCNTSKFEGTIGYFAPEYCMNGIVDEKTDVYAFGVLLLELLTGRRPIDDSQHSIVQWAKPLLDKNSIEELVDPSLDNNYTLEEVERVALTASLCVEHSPFTRPRMSQVVIMLRGDEYVTEACKKRTLQRTYSEEILDAQEYNSTKYLNDIERFREIAFGS